MFRWFSNVRFVSRIIYRKLHFIHSFNIDDTYYNTILFMCFGYMKNLIFDWKLFDDNLLIFTHFIVWEGLLFIKYSVLVFYFVCHH